MCSLNLRARGDRRGVGRPFPGSPEVVGAGYLGDGHIRLSGPAGVPFPTRPFTPPGTHSTVLGTFAVHLGPSSEQRQGPTSRRCRTLLPSSPGTVTRLTLSGGFITGLHSDDRSAAFLDSVRNHAVQDLHGCATENGTVCASPAPATDRHSRASGVPSPQRAHTVMCITLSTLKGPTVPSGLTARSPFPPPSLRHEDDRRDRPPDQR